MESERKLTRMQRGDTTLTRLLVVAIFCSGLAAGGPGIDQARADQDANIEIGTRLADMLRAGRSIVSANQALIDNPEIGDKGFSGDSLVQQAEELYTERVGAPPDAEGLSEAEMALIEAQKEAMRRVVDAHQADINQKGVGFKGFIPAVFARLVNEEFTALVGAQARVRVAAPPDLVRNRKARPDDWELGILENRFLVADWPKNTPYMENLSYEGRPAFRMLLPEYYRASCLICHGEPKGEVDITGYPKEGGKAGDLAGAISIVIFQ